MARRTPARRFLAPQARAGNGLGYLSQPQREYPVVADEPELVDRIATCTDWRDEPEGLDRLDYELHIDERAKRDAEQQLRFETRQREQSRRLMDFEQRLATVQADARRRRIDVTS